MYFRPDGGETYDHRAQATDRPLFAYDPDQDGPVDPNTQIFDVTTRGEARAIEEAGLELHGWQAQVFEAAEDVGLDVDSWTGSMDELYDETVRLVDAHNAAIDRRSTTSQEDFDDPGVIARLSRNAGQAIHAGEFLRLTGQELSRQC